MDVTKKDVREAYQYFGQFYTVKGRVISKMFIARTDKDGEKLKFKSAVFQKRIKEKR